MTKLRLFILAVSLITTPAFAYSVAEIHQKSVHDSRHSDAPAFSYATFDNNGVRLADYRIFVARNHEGAQQIYEADIQFPSPYEREMRAALVGLLTTDSPTSIALRDQSGTKTSHLFFTLPPGKTKDTPEILVSGSKTYSANRDLVVVDAYRSTGPETSLATFLENMIQSDSANLLRILTEDVDSTHDASIYRPQLSPNKVAALRVSSDVLLKPTGAEDMDPLRIGGNNTFSVVPLDEEGSAAKSINATRNLSSF